MDDIKAELRNEYNAGDYSHTGTRVEPASVDLAAALGIKRGDRVLDVAAGTGNFALAAAAGGAAVTALDLSSAMIAAGRRRSGGDAIAWHEGDAESLPFADGTFDVCASVFGVMFAPDQPRAAAELARVVKPGGKVAVAAWTPEGKIGRFIRAIRGPFKGKPAETPAPLIWGTREGIEELLGPHCTDITTRSKWVTFRYGSWDEYMAALESTGSAVTAKKTLPRDAYERGLAAVRELIEGFNQATDGTVAYMGEYLETIALKR